MAAFLDVCRFIPTAGGTSAWTFASAVGGYQSPVSAGAVNGIKYKYRAESTDLTQWEVGEGTWSSSTGVLSRATVLFNSSGTTSLISFNTVPQVAVVALAEDLTVTNPAAKSDQQAASSAALAVTPAHQQDHPSSPKAWAYITQSGGVYALAASYGVASISKASTGTVDVTLSIPFASTSFAALAMS